MSSFARELLRGAEWRDLTDTLSPALFDAVPATALAATASSLVRGRLDRKGKRRALRERSELLEAHGLPVAISESTSPSALPTEERARRARGDAVLRLYFHQLVAGTTAFIDLRAARFSGTGLPLQWNPGWARHRWKPDFKRAIADLYAGFYEDQEARFDAALEPLGIAPAREVFLEHFGSGDQRAVRFSAQEFRETFHRAFVACRDAGSPLHPDFIPMGIMLASLYAHLEPLELALDVRSAWGDVAGVLAAA